MGVRLRRAFGTAAAALLLAAGLCIPVHAQTTSASVAGAVKDAQGAVLPGATVTMTSNSQGTDMTAVTDALGNFLFPYVRPDRYTLKISLEGFTTLQGMLVIVNANDRVAAGTFTMQVGSLNETVTVTGESPQIQLRSGERAFTMESSAMQNVAVNGRSPFQLAMLVPGVVPNTDNPTQPDSYNVNGQRNNSNNMTVDGVANIDTGNNGTPMAQTNLDAIAEFKVLTSSYQAEYGRAVGGQIQVVTKSGTQKFSGSGYWYGRRSDWNAETWTNNRDGRKMAKSARNDQGYTFGGPLYIPGLFNTDKKKLFFFWSQEFQRRKDPVGEQRVTVPTALERKGDFSASVDANGNPYPYIRDYQLAQANPGWGCGPTDQRACFKDGGVLGKIPANRLYAPTLAALSLLPMPNTTGQKGYNYSSQTPGTNPLDQQMLRADYQVNNNWRVTGRYMWHSNMQDMPYGVGGWSVGGNLDVMKVTNSTPGRNWMFSSTGVLNNTTSLELSFGQAHNSLDHFMNNSDLTRKHLAELAGGAQLPMLYTDPIQEDYIPYFIYGGGRIGNAPVIRIHQAPFTNFNTTYDGVANLTKVLGTHQAKAGLYYQSSLKPQSAFAPVNGQINFDNSGNNPYDSSHPFANAALGIYNQFQQASAFVKPNWSYKNIEWYLQDNWKTTDRLTLDYGIRFYYMTPQWDTSEKVSNFRPENFVASQAVRLFKPAVINGARVGYDAATGQKVDATYIGRVVPSSGDRFQGTIQGGSLTNGNKVKVSPRLGFAYDITGKQSLVARGGFGIFYDRPQGNMVFDKATNPPSMQVTTLQWVLANQVGGTGSTPLYGPVGLQPDEYAWKVPTVYQWNLGMQMRLPASFTLDVAYVGSESRNLLQQRQLNSPAYGSAFKAENQDPTRGQSCTGCSGLSSTPGGNALPIDFMRPYQGYGAIRMYEFGAYANYKALQTTVSRRFDRGFMFSLNYTRSEAKGIIEGDFTQVRIDGRDKEANYGPLNYNRPHTIVATWVYQTPDVVKGPLGFLANGWQLSGNYRWLMGTPYTAGYSIPGIGPINLTGTDQGARIALTGQPVSSGHTSDPYNQFNVAAFTAPNTGSVGLESPRYTMYGRGVNNMDLSLAKSFGFGGKRRMEVRLDAFNALNHTQFSGINNTLNFVSLADRTITNLPYDSTGKLVNRNGVGTITGVRAARQLQLMTRFIF